MDLILQDGVSDLHLMRRPDNPGNDNSYRNSDKRHSYLYQEENGQVFYYYVDGQDQNQKQSKQKHYLPVYVESHLFNSASEHLEYCVDEALRKSVFDITTQRKHTLRSHSEELRRMVEENGALLFVVYCPTKEEEGKEKEEDKIARNAGGQRISLVGKTLLQVARGEKNDYAIAAMTKKLLDIKDEKQKQDISKKFRRNTMLRMPPERQTKNR